MKRIEKQKKEAVKMLNDMSVSDKFACNTYSITKHYRHYSPAADNYQTEIWFSSYLVGYIILGQEKKEFCHGYGISNQVFKEYMENREADMDFFSEAMYSEYFLKNLAKIFKAKFQEKNKTEVRDYRILWEYMQSVLGDVADFVEIEDDYVLIWNGQFFSIKYGYEYSYNEQGRYERIMVSKYIKNHELKKHEPIIGYNSWFDSKNQWRCHYELKA